MLIGNKPTSSTTQSLTHLFTLLSNVSVFGLVVDGHFSNQYVESSDSEDAGIVS